MDTLKTSIKFKSLHIKQLFICLIRINLLTILKVGRAGNIIDTEEFQQLLNDYNIKLKDESNNHVFKGLNITCYDAYFMKDNAKVNCHLIPKNDETQDLSFISTLKENVMKSLEELNHLYICKIICVKSLENFLVIIEVPFDYTNYNEIIKYCEKPKGFANDKVHIFKENVLSTFALLKIKLYILIDVIIYLNQRNVILGDLKFFTTSFLSYETATIKIITPFNIISESFSIQKKIIYLPWSKIVEDEDKDEEIKYDTRCLVDLVHYLHKKMGLKYRSHKKYTEFLNFSISVKSFILNNAPLNVLLFDEYFDNLKFVFNYLKMKNFIAYTDFGVIVKTNETLYIKFKNTLESQNRQHPIILKITFLGTENDLNEENLSFTRFAFEISYRLIFIGNHDLFQIIRNLMLIISNTVKKIHNMNSYVCIKIGKNLLFYKTYDACYLHDISDLYEGYERFWISCFNLNKKTMINLNEMVYELKVLVFKFKYSIKEHDCARLSIQKPMLFIENLSYDWAEMKKFNSFLKNHFNDDKLSELQIKFKSHKKDDIENKAKNKKSNSVIIENYELSYIYIEGLGKRNVTKEDGRSLNPSSLERKSSTLNNTNAKKPITSIESSKSSSDKNKTKKDTLKKPIRNQQVNDGVNEIKVDASKMVYEFEISGGNQKLVFNEKEICKFRQLENYETMSELEKKIFDLNSIAENCLVIFDEERP